MLPSGAGTLRAHEAAAHALEAADRLVRDRLHEPDLRGEPRHVLDRAARAERAPVVDEQRRLAAGLRQQDEDHVDVLARVVHDRQEARRAGRVGVLRVPAEVERPLARELEAPVVDLALDRVRVRDPVVLGAVLPARRDLLEQIHRLALLRALDQPDALVVDHEQRRRLRVVGAARGPARHVQERRAELLAAVRPVDRPVVHDGAGRAGGGDQDRLLERCQRRRVVRALVGHLAGLERHALRHPARAPVLEAGGHRVGEEVLQARVLRGRLRRGHELWRSSSARAIGNTSRSASLPSQQSRCA